MNTDDNTLCICLPEVRFGYKYNQFIGTYFQNCVHSPWDYTAFALGMLNMGCYFTIVHIPQFITNYRNKSTAGLSPLMLILWGIGDILGLIGHWLNNTGGTLFWTQAYYWFINMVLLLQYAYYTYFYQRDKELVIGTLNSTVNGGNISKTCENDGTINNDDGTRSLLHDGPTEDSSSPSSCDDSSSSTTPNTKSILISSSNASNTHLAINISPTTYLAIVLSIIITLALPITTAANVQNTMMTLASTTFDGFFRILTGSNERPLCTGEVLSLWQRNFGAVLNYVCCSIYAPARIPQIILNYRRKSTHGLSKLFVCVAMFASLCFMGSIVLSETNIAIYDHFTNVDAVRGILPYLVYNITAICSSSIIVYQMFIYRHNDEYGNPASQL